jgi:hypothetical protein
MKTTRRQAMLGSLTAAAGAGVAAQGLSGCSPQTDVEAGQETRVTVIGAIHGNHRRSERYSLDVLRKALRRAEPQVVLTEIPPGRIEQARKSFAETGKVDEPRTRVFPELTEVVFPLSREMDYRILPTAGWTQELADDRTAALKAIAADPTRASQWAEHQAAQAEFRRAVAGRGDDPRFIHTREYDVMVQRAQTPYQIYFDPDLGPGGWTRINAAHNRLIGAAVDTVAGQGLSVLIIFGAQHKHMIERALLLRSDVVVQDARALFD